MIGDNPKSDIRGANALGWSSILVKYTIKYLLLIPISMSII